VASSRFAAGRQHQKAKGRIIVVMQRQTANASAAMHCPAWERVIAVCCQGFGADWQPCMVLKGSHEGQP